MWHDLDAGMPGFEGRCNGEAVLYVTKTKPGQNHTTMPSMNESLANACRVYWAAIESGVPLTSVNIG
jgi:hypothetical protein